MELINPRDFKVTFTNRFFFDTNIWLLLYGTIADVQKENQKVYSSLFSEILQRNSTVYISSVIISEFANVILRKDFRQWITSNKLINQEYKRDFVGTSEYKDSVAIVKNLIGKILRLPCVLRISDAFSNVNLENIFARFGSVDFNDSYITELCEENSYILVTNDRDFSEIDSPLTIITN